MFGIESKWTANAGQHRPGIGLMPFDCHFSYPYNVAAHCCIQMVYLLFLMATKTTLINSETMKQIKAALSLARTFRKLQIDWSLR